MVFAFSIENIQASLLESPRHGEREREPRWTSATPVAPAPGSTHAPARLRHRRAPAADLRRTPPHEPPLPAADALAIGNREAAGTARPRFGQATASPAPGAGRGPADPGGWWARCSPANGITRCERGIYALVGGEELSDTERDQLSSAASASMPSASGSQQLWRSDQF
jgi:hypothetical protein